MRLVLSVTEDRSLTEGEDDLSLLEVLVIRAINSCLAFPCVLLLIVHSGPYYLVLLPLLQY